MLVRCSESERAKRGREARKGERRETRREEFECPLPCKKLCFRSRSSLSLDLDQLTFLLLCLRSRAPIEFKKKKTRQDLPRLDRARLRVRQAPPHPAPSGAPSLLRFLFRDCPGAPAKAPALLPGAVRGRAAVRDALRGRGRVLGAEPRGRRAAVLASALRGKDVFFFFLVFWFLEKRERERETGKERKQKNSPPRLFSSFSPSFLPSPPPPQIQTQKQEIKVAFLAWLLLPGTRGADVLFERAFVPLLEEHGPALDAAVSRARATVSAHASEKAGLALKALRGKAAAAVAQLQAAAASAGASASASPAKRKA